MGSIRIHNDITVAVHVKRNGTIEDFTGKQVDLVLVVEDKKIPVKDFTMDDGIIRFLFPAVIQRYLGIYDILIRIKDSDGSVHTVDKCHAFRLVSRSCYASGTDDSDVETTSIEYSLDLKTDAGGSIIIDSTLSPTSVNPVQNKAIHDALLLKVDKEEGKGLSTNDFTTPEKQKLDRLSNYDDSKIKEEIAKKQDKGNYLTDAPRDDNMYARKNGSWVKVSNTSTPQETVTISLNVLYDADDSILTNRVITVKYADVVNEITYEGTPVSVDIPETMEYEISVEKISDYVSPEPQTYVAVGGNTRNISLTYRKVSTLIFDTSISDPSNITGDVNVGAIQAILSMFRRCLCKKTAEGEVCITYLKNADSYEDGSAASLDGSEGDVMTYIPDIYYKYEKIDNKKFAYKLSVLPADDTYIHIPCSLLGTYKGYVENNKLYSRSGVTPSYSITYSNYEVYANARGKGYIIIDYHQHCIIALMLYAKYGNRDLQAVLGPGSATYSPATQTGTTNALWNEDTVDNPVGYVNGLSIEGVFGGAYEVVSKVSIRNKIWIITNIDGSTREVSAGVSSGWIVEIAASKGPHFDVIPIYNGGSSALYYADYHWSSNSGPYCLLRSCDSSSANGGVSFASANYSTSIVSSNVGSRLAFRGVIREASSASEFKSLPIID